jgi:putative hydrolase of the HAD superfamily
MRHSEHGIRDVSIRGLIFDYGGVLWDMRWDVSAALAREHGLEERALVETMYGQNPHWREIEVGLGDRDAWLREAHDSLERLAGKPLPPVHQHWREQQGWITANLDLIRSLRTAYRTAVLSNADNTLRARFLAHEGLLDLFDEFICSADVGMAKPDPRIYALAAERMRLPPAECVFVDDLERNLEPARAAGMATVHFRSDEGHSLEAQLAELGVTAGG